jgi:hypothetical protein
MALRDRVNESQQTNLGPESPSGGNLDARREEVQGHLRAGLDAIDRGLSETGSNRRFLEAVRQQGGE